MDIETMRILFGGVLGAVGAGIVGLISYFIKQYFTTSEARLSKSEEKITDQMLALAGITARLDEQSRVLIDISAKLNFMEKQISKVFSVIDAPRRSTDINLNGGRRDD